MENKPAPKAEAKSAPQAANAPGAIDTFTKTRKGNEVKETYEGKIFNPNSGDKDASKLYDVKGETTRTFDPKYGFMSKMDSKVTEPDGAQVEQHLEAKAKETERGLETSQTLTGKRTKDGKSESTELKESRLKSNEGEQLVSASGKVVDTEGREAIHEIGENGEKMRIKSPGQKEREGTEPENLSGVEKELMATAAATNAERVGSEGQRGRSRPAGQTPQRPHPALCGMWTCMWTACAGISRSGTASRTTVINHHHHGHRGRHRRGHHHRHHHRRRGHHRSGRHRRRA